MYVKCGFELSMTVANEEFQNILFEFYRGDDYISEIEDEYTDHSLSDKGITITYRNSRYKKKVKLIVNADRDSLSVSKLGKAISDYFEKEYSIDDFTLSGMRISTDIKVGSRADVHSYMKIMKRIGRIKKFTPYDSDEFDGGDVFYLRGNSNGIDFLVYDLEGVTVGRLTKSRCSYKDITLASDDVKGKLRAEVRLTKSRTVAAYTESLCIADQLEELFKKQRSILVSIFAKIIPYGDFYKKEDADEIVRTAVKDQKLCRRMLRLLALIPEKKSLHLAQKEMHCRSIDDVMLAFTKINLSPVTISKRQDAKHLKNIYDHLLKECV